MPEPKEHPYDRAISLASDWLDKGYVNSWFKWVEWLGLTSLLIAVAVKAPTTWLKIVVGIPAFGSALLVYFSAIAVTERYQNKLIERYRNKGKLGGIVVFLVAVGIPSVLFYTVLLVIFTEVEKA